MSKTMYSKLQNPDKCSEKELKIKMLTFKITFTIYQ